MMNSKNRKIAVTVVTAIFILALYGIIFAFSEQDGKESSSVSRKVSVACVNTVNKMTKQSWSEKDKLEITDSVEPFVRKLAHFSEYALLGLLICILLSQWIRKQLRFSMLWIFLSACADEFHQTFVPGRDGNFLDVLIDSSGGLLGVLVCIGIWRLILLMMRKKR